MSSLRPFAVFPLLLCCSWLAGCGSGEQEAAPSPQAEAEDPAETALLNKYKTVRLSADLSDLSAGQQELIGLLIEAADAMDTAFWKQAYGERDALLRSIQSDSLRRYAEINYGPWDRLNSNAPFVPGFDAKPAGATFYPTDMDTAEFEQALEAAEDGGAAMRSHYTVLRRDAEGQLVTQPYSEAYFDEYRLASQRLKEAAALAEDEGFKRYLELRSEALLSNDYLASDLAWMDMKSNSLDVVIGPIETYEDQLLGFKAASSAYILVKDLQWSERLTRYASFLPDLQRGLPVPEQYRQEEPGTDSDLGAYDVIYYAGDCNAGSKTIAINLPNDERVQLEKGTRRLQLKNAMRAKFDEILLPIADVLVAEDQRAKLSFDAFFSNTMFHEVAHGLGIKQTINGKGTVREALREHASALEEGKADVLGLYMVTQLHAQGELGEDADLEQNYVTFLASIFRSIRFGGSSAHGVANLIRFNYFAEQGAFSRDPATGTYRADMEAMGKAMSSLSEIILTLQGDGNYEAVSELVERYGKIGAELQADLDRLSEAGIPVDIVFEQGREVLGL